MEGGRLFVSIGLSFMLTAACLCVLYVRGVAYLFSYASRRPLTDADYHKTIKPIK